MEAPSAGLKLLTRQILQLSVTKGDRVEAWAHQNIAVLGRGKRLQSQSEITGKFPGFPRCSDSRDHRQVP